MEHPCIRRILVGVGETEGLAGRSGGTSADPDLSEAKKTKRHFLLPIQGLGQRYGRWTDTGGWNLRFPPERAQRGHGVYVLKEMQDVEIGVSALFSLRDSGNFNEFIVVTRRAERYL